MTNTTFACFDVETTRLDPLLGRIIEIAVVRISPANRTTGEWTTLINPGTSDLGRIDIHGIQSNWLAGAPTFLDIAGDLGDFMDDCVPVAHNAGFDKGFLCAEWNRAGLGSLDIDPIDTLRLAKGLGLPGRLGELAEALDIPFENAHTALGDSRALSRILIELLQQVKGPIPSPCFNPPLLTPPASGRVTPRPVIAA